MDKILDKVKKLISLANCEAASENERESAMRMAHNLLAKHNLNMQNVQEHEAVEGRLEIELQTYSMAWTRDLASIIARLFFCKYYYSTYKINATKGTHYFFGKESNAITASLIASYVINSILKEARKLYKHNLCSESRSFAIGATAKINTRVKLMMAENFSAADGTSLVLYDLYKTEEDANNLAFKSKLKVVKLRAQQPVNFAAYSAGKEFGDRVNLNGQIVNKDQLRLK